MSRPNQLETRDGAGSNGETQLVYSNALYQAFKAFLLGSGSQLITNGQEDEKFLRAQRARLEKNLKPKVGHWIRYENDAAKNVEIQIQPANRGDRIHYSPLYTTTIKFIPPVAEDALKKLIAQFKQDFGITDIKEGNSSCLGIQFRLGNAGEVNIDIPESEFDKIKAQVVANAASRTCT